MLARLKSPWITFWPLWLLASLLSFYGVMGIFAVPSMLTDFGAGVLLAGLQWLLLRSYMGVDYTWFAASVVVYSSFFSIARGWGFVSAYAFDATCILCLGILGLLQRAVLKNFVDRSDLWLMASPGVAILSVAAMLLWRPPTFYTPETVWLVLGVAYGAITGAIIIWLKQTTRPFVDDTIPPWKRAGRASS